MRNAKPPAVAAWLLNRFGSSEMNDALAGDLAEHYRCGRSRWWYWREVVVGLSVGVLSDAWRHKLIVPLALLLGWLVTANVGPRLMKLMIAGPQHVASIAVAEFAMGCLTGLLLALLYRPRHIAPILFFAMSYLAAEDLYPLLSRGIQMSASVGTRQDVTYAPLPAVYWLMTTAIDLMFVVGLLWTGTFRVHRASGGQGPLSSVGVVHGLDTRLGL